jgi:translocation protein SEC63
MGDGAVISVLSSGEEFHEILKGNKADHGASKVEQKILEPGQVTPTKAGLTEKDRRTLQDMEGVRRKVLSLLWAYLGRVELSDPALNDGKYFGGLFQTQTNSSQKSLRSHRLPFSSTKPSMPYPLHMESPILSSQPTTLPKTLSKPSHRAHHPYYNSHISHPRLHKP